MFVFPLLTPVKVVAALRFHFGRLNLGLIWVCPAQDATKCITSPALWWTKIKRPPSGQLQLKIYIHSNIFSESAHVCQGSVILQMVLVTT